MLSLVLLSLKRLVAGVALGCACLTVALPALANDVQGKYLPTGPQSNPPFPFLQGANQIAVASGYKAIHELNDADFTAKCIIYCTHLQTNYAAADDQHAIGNVCQS